MAGFEFIDGLGPAAWVAVFGLIIAFIVLGRRISFGILDPWFTLFFNQGLLLALLAILLFTKLISGSTFLYWLCATALFILPFFWVHRVTFPLFTSASDSAYRWLRLANLLILLLAAYQFAFDVIFVSARGIPILYANGSNPEIYIGGLGIVKYIHDGCKFILPPLAVFSLFVTGKRRFFVLGLFASLYPAVLFEWSKAGLFLVISNFWISAQVFFGPRKLLKRATIIGVSTACLFMLFMFSRVAATGYADNAFDSLFTRLIESGDSVFFYFVMNGRNGISHDFTFLRYAFSYVAPFFGADPFKGNVGHALLEAVDISAESGYGPSPPFQVIGHMLFHDFGALYALSIGIILAWAKGSLRRRSEAAAVF